MPRVAVDPVYSITGACAGSRITGSSGTLGRPGRSSRSGRGCFWAVHPTQVQRIARALPASALRKLEPWAFDIAPDVVVLGAAFLEAVSGPVLDGVVLDVTMGAVVTAAERL
ncbi:hypothetical protein MKK84_34900 [Methylobacterium sp. E-065]|uniref:hypothetical protein n=1 Tax=Methylobacterium sp. E-065 TaxID=2836583 RepID=UPI001FB92663|nr:hypothetical protein [Methylobacterium sp. E-065]MCJ2022534.1 hypothetical protein [Methylobacterium sp. E-065]